jgi:hypothetical protein
MIVNGLLNASPIYKAPRGFFATARVNQHTLLMVIRRSCGGFTVGNSPYSIIVATDYLSYFSLIKLDRIVAGEPNSNAQC